MSGRSVWERLGPMPADYDVPSQAAPAPPAAASTGRSVPAPPGLRMALSHPLVSRHLRAAAQEVSERGSSSSSKCSSRSSSRGPAGGRGGAQRRVALPGAQQQQQDGRRQRQQQPRQRRKEGTNNIAASGDPHLPLPSPQQQRPEGQPQPTRQRRSGGNQDSIPSSSRAAADASEEQVLKEQLRRMQGERDAADTMLRSMAQQTQALLAEKQALQRQAAELESQKARLEERLEFLLPGGEDEEWAACGEGDEGDPCESGGSSSCQPDTPGISSLGAVTLQTLQLQLEQLEMEQQAAALAGTADPQQQEVGSPS